MQAFFKNILRPFWSRPKAKPQREVLGVIDVVDDDDTHRYPPFTRGLAVVPVTKVLNTQAELIERIRTALGLNKKEFNELLLPVLYNYAAFVHFLPASEAHHHRGAGGLFRHGLEAAFAAAQASEGVIFSIEGTPKEKRDNEPRWRMASTLAGLLHDAGKPMSDVVVLDRDTGKTWNAFYESLVDWATRNNIERYYLNWREDRHKNHESFALAAFEMIVPKETNAYLNEPGSAISLALRAALSHSDLNSPVSKLMLFGDRESVQRDLKENRINIDDLSSGVPVERLLFDAIRRLINNGRWQVNVPGGRVWHLHQGVFIAWRNLGDLFDIFDRDKTPGIPRDPDTLADILLERDYAIWNKVTENGEEATYRYWEVQPEGVPAKILMLRFESHEIVFTSEPPPPINAIITGENDSSTKASSNPDSQADHSVEGEQSSSIEAIETAGEDAEEEDGESITVEATQTTAAVASQVDSILGDIGFSDNLGVLTPNADAEPEPEPEPEEIKGESSEAQTSKAVPAKTANPVKEKPTKTEQSTEPAPKKPVLNSALSALDKPIEPAKLSHVKDSKAAQPVESVKTESINPDKDSARKPKLSHVKQSGFSGLPGKPANSQPKPQSGLIKPSEGERPQNKEGMPGAAKKPGATFTQAAKAAENEKVKTPVKTPIELLLDELKKYKKEAREILETALLPYLKRNIKLGTNVAVIGGQTVITIPQGISLLGKTPDVINTLFDAGALQLNPVMPETKVQDVAGVRCLVLNSEISSVFRQTYEQATLERGKKTSIDAPARNQRDNKAKPVKEVKTKRAKSSLQSLDAAITEQPKQNRAASRLLNRPSKRTEPDLAEQPKNTDTDSTEQLMSEAVDEMEADASTRFVEQLDETDDNLISTADEGTSKKIAAELKDMFINKKGRWLVTPVIEHKEGYMTTSDKALDQILAEHPTYSKSKLRGYLIRSEYRFRFRRNQIHFK